MRIKSFLLILFLASVLTASLAFFLITKHFVGGEFDRLEHEASSISLNQIEKNIEAEIDGLGELAIQYSAWDDTFEFIKKPKPEYLKVNYEAEMMLDARLNSVVLLDEKFDVKYCRRYNYEKRIFLTCEEEEGLVDQAIRLSQMLNMDKGAVTLRGWMSLDSDVGAIFSLHPITRSNDRNVRNGYLLMTRTLDQNLLARIEELTQIKLAYKFESRISVTKPIPYKEARADRIHLYVPFGIQNSEKIITFEGIYPRTITKKGAESVLTSLVFSLIMIVFLISTVIYLFSKQVVNPIGDLQNQLKRIAESHSLTSRLTISSTNEIGSLAKEINKTLGKLEETSTALGQSSKFSALGKMSAQIAHEINNPMAVIMGAADKLKSQSQHLNSNQIEDIAEKMSRVVKRVTNIIKAMKMLSHDGAELDKEVFAFKDVFDEILILSESNLTTKSISFFVSESVAGLQMYGNRVLISQVFMNLISNSIDALESLPEPRWIRVDLESAENDLRIKFIDSGQGLGEADLDKVFDAFYTTKAPGKGTGLGLSISKQILVQHSGTLAVDSKEKNTTFVVSLPRNAFR